MARLCRGLSATCFGAALVFGLFINVIIIFKGKNISLFQRRIKQLKLGTQDTSRALFPKKKRSFSKD